MTSSLPNLFEIAEVQAVFETLYYVSWLLMAFIVIIFILHSEFELTGSSALYRKRQPRPNWSKLFYPAIMTLIVLVGLAMWVLFNLSLGIVIWA